MAEGKKSTSKNTLLGAAIALLVIGGVGFAVSNNDSDGDESANTSQNQTNETEASEAPVAATENIVELAVGNESLTTLVSAVTEAELVDTLSGEGPFTVFAPTDAAFEDTLQALDITAEQLLASEDLTRTLTYHVVPAEAMAGDLVDGQMIETVQGQNLLVRIEDDGVYINEAKVVTADVAATNGVVHVIDSVLSPLNDEELTELKNGTVVDIAVENDFNTLVAAVTEAELAETLSGEGPFTVFAPTDAAFGDLLAALDVSADDLLAREDLGDILKYHVVAGKVLSTDLVSGTNVDTILGQEWHVLINDNGVFIADPTTAEPIAEVITTDVVGTNGVVHVIDSVLIP